MNGYFFWHEVDIWNLKNKLFLNLNYFLLIIKLSVGPEILFPWP